MCYFNSSNSQATPLLCVIQYSMKPGQVLKAVLMFPMYRFESNTNKNISTDIIYLSVPLAQLADYVNNAKIKRSMATYNTCKTHTLNELSLWIKTFAK